MTLCSPGNVFISTFIDFYNPSFMQEFYQGLNCKNKTLLTVYFDENERKCHGKYLAGHKTN